MNEELPDTQLETEHDFTADEPDAPSFVHPTETAVLPEDDRIPTIPQLCVALGILLVVFCVPYITPYVHFTVSGVHTPTSTAPLSQGALVYRSNVFDSVQLEAQSAYVWDASLQKALFNKNAHAQLPLASLTKLMTALVVSETKSPESDVAITLPAIQQEGENGFKEGEEWKTKDLLDYTLITSSNDGAYALAASAGSALLTNNLSPEDSFLRAMNKKAEEIGLTQTYFTNPTGLDASESQSGSYGSARDMAFLMEYILHTAPDLLAKTAEPAAQISDAAGLTFTATNTNQEIGTIDNALGSKTGYTTLAGGNLVVAFNVGLNHPIIVSVMGSSREGRFTDVQKLIEHVKEAYTPQP